MRKSGFVLSSLALLAIIFAACAAPAAAPTPAPATTAAKPATTAAPPASAPTTAAAKPPTSAATGKPIKIGALIAISGAISVWGDATLAAEKLYFDEIFNKQGGAGGRPVELVIADSQSTSDMALARFQDLAGNPEIMAIMGPNSSTETKTTVPAARRLRIPQVIIAMTAGLTQLPDAEYTFRANINDAFLIDTLIRMAYDKMKVRKFGLIYSTDPYGDSFRTAAKDIIGKLDGAKIVAEQSGEQQGTDFTIQLLALRRAEPELVLVGLQNPGSTYVPKNAAEIGWDIPLGGTTPLNDPTVVKISGKAAEGVIFSDTSAPDEPKPGIQAQLKQMWPQTGKQWHIASNMGFAAAQTVSEGLKLAVRNGWEINRENLRKAMEQLEIDTPMGHAVYSPTDHDGPRPGSNIIGRIKDGKFVLWNPRPVTARSDVVKD